MEMYSSVVYTTAAYAASVETITIIEKMARDTISDLEVKVGPSSIVMVDNRPVPATTRASMIKFLDNLLGKGNYIVKFDLKDYNPENVTYTRYILNR